jgi:hypothetical protein
MPANAALGIVPHTGWAWLVRVEGTRRAPRATARERLVACDVLEGELYHRAAEYGGDRERFLASRRARAVTQTRKALGPRLAGIGDVVVVGKQTALPPLERVLVSHPLIHGAEGELWRAIFAEASAGARVRVRRTEAALVRAALEETQGAADVEAFLASAKRALGPPWSREPQDAALAAWSALH